MVSGARERRHTPSTDELGSGSLAVTDALLTAEDGVTAVTWIVMVAVAPPIMVPRRNVTVPPACEQLPCVGVAEIYDTVDGNVSVAVTLVASEGPLLVTFRV